MIIWGTRGRTTVVEAGQFHCPRCGTQRPCNLKQVRNYFTLYFIPVIPLDIAGRYVECTSCAGTFAEEAMHYDPEKERQETNSQMLRIMILAALADGAVDAAESRVIQQQYQELAGLPIPSATLENEISLAVSANANLNSYVARIADQLSAHGKALVVQLSFQVMSAAGELQPGHQQQLAQLGKTLGIPDDQYLELMQQLHEPGET